MRIPANLDTILKFCTTVIPFFVISDYVLVEFFCFKLILFLVCIFSFLNWHECLCTGGPRLLGTVTVHTHTYLCLSRGFRFHSEFYHPHAFMVTPWCFVLLWCHTLFHVCVPQGFTLAIVCWPNKLDRSNTDTKNKFLIVYKHIYKKWLS